MSLIVENNGTPAPQNDNTRALTPDILTLANRYNVNPKDLNPEVYLVESCYFNAELFDKIVSYTHLVPANIFSKAQVVESLKTAVMEKDAVFLGINHYSHKDHEAIAHMLSQVNIENTTIAIEVEPELNDAVNLFITTGKFREQDNPEAYTRIYKGIRNQSGNKEISPENSGTFFEEHPEIVALYPILLTAKSKKAKVLCFDTLLNTNEFRSQKTETAMFEALNKEQSHLIVIAGTNHIRTGEYSAVSLTPDQQFQYENVTTVRTLMEQAGKTAVSYYLDSAQTINNTWQTNEVSETVLHRAVANLANSTGILSNIVGYKDPEIANLIHAEVYVAIN